MKIPPRYTAVFLLALVVACPCVALAQDTPAVQTLKSVEIITYRPWRTAHGSSFFSIDSLCATPQGLDAALSNQNLFVRNYGLGTLALPAVRGTNASQTAVMWQGINLQSTMNGGADLALMPNFLFDQAHVHLGGGSSLYGSGAMGSTIILGNKYPFRNTGLHTQIQSQIGSFGHYFGGLKAEYHHEKWYVNIKALRQNTDNNIEYKSLDFGFPIKTLTNARSQQQGYTASVGYRPSTHHFIEAHVWQQHTNRQIPPTLTTNTSRAHQTDSTLRTAITWQYNKQKIWAKTQVSYASEKIFYADSAIVLFAQNHARTALADAQIIYEITEKINISIGANQQIIQAKTDAYAQQHQQSQTAASVQMNIKPNDKLAVSFAARQQWVEYKHGAFTYTIGTDYYINKKNALSANFSTNYRLPTFNDLFWNDGNAVGNPDLLPEYAKTASIGYKMGCENNFVGIDVFYNDIRNNISWQFGQNVWQPKNLLRTHAKGVEMNLKKTKNVAKAQIIYNIKHTYTQAINAQTQTQLTYTPKHQSSADVKISIKKINLQYQQQYVGKRYTTLDNADFIKSYTVANVSAGYNFKITEKYRVSAQVFINNIYNANYQVMAYKITPPRNVLCSFIIQN